jgi:hypothetical protein
MADPSSERDPVARLAEEFLQRRRRGKRPSLSEYTARHPEHAEAIRALFPMLIESGPLKPGPGPLKLGFVSLPLGARAGRPGDPVGRPTKPPREVKPGPPERLGAGGRLPQSWCCERQKSVPD